jgi:hypothetical protein
MTYALREARALAARALPAPIAWKIALTALAALGLSGEPFHARSPASLILLLRVTLRRTLWPRRKRASAVTGRRFYRPPPYVV